MEVALEIYGLEVYGYHGALPEERERGQPFLFDVTLVAHDAGKPEIRRAVEALFKVKVTGVRTMVRTGKLKGRGKMKRRMPDWKRAVVTLKAGDTVEFL